MESAGMSVVLLYELLFFIAMNVFWIGLYYTHRKRGVPAAVGRPLVSVVVPVYNKVAHLKGTLDSLRGLRYPNTEVIVVDDGSTDGSRQVAERYCQSAGWVFLKHEKNAGKAAALNTGIRAATGELVLTCDADSLLEPNSLEQMVSHFSDPRVGAVAGMVSVEGGPGLLRRFQTLEYLHQAFQRVIQGFFSAVMVLPGPISLYRKTVISEAGWFGDSTLVEDWDMTMKVHKLGYKVLSVRGAEAKTAAPAHLKDWWRQRVRWSRGGLQILEQHNDIFRKSKNKAMTTVMFPIHILWLVVPLIVVPTMVYVLLPDTVALSAAWADFMVLLGMLNGVAVRGFSLLELFKVADVLVADFLDFRTFGILRLAGYLSGLAFIWFTFTALKTMKAEFSPRQLLTVLLMPIYWMMMNVVYLYAMVLELAKGEFRW